MPLTADRAKPAVPFAGIYRLIDFALSNVVNCGYLESSCSRSTSRTASTGTSPQTWRMSTLLGNYVPPVPAQQRVGKHWYLGSADAIYQSLNLMHDEQPDIVVVVGADHVYRMDFCADGRPARRERSGVHGGRDPAADLPGRPVRRDRRRARGAPRDPRVPREADRPAGLPDNPHEVLASMGNYVFDADALVEAVTRDSTMRRLQARHGRRHRAGVRAARRGRRLRLQGQRRCPARPTATAATGATSGPCAPTTRRTWTSSRRCRCSTSTTSEWPIYTSYGPQPPAKLVQGADGNAARAEEAVLSPGRGRQRVAPYSARCCRPRCRRRAGRTWSSARC